MADSRKRPAGGDTAATKAGEPGHGNTTYLLQGSVGREREREREERETHIGGVSVTGSGDELAGGRPDLAEMTGSASRPARRWRPAPEAAPAPPARRQAGPEAAPSPSCSARKRVRREKIGEGELRMDCRGGRRDWDFGGTVLDW